MIDPTALPLEAQQVQAQLATSWASEARALAAGLAYTAAVVALGAIAVVFALVVGVVAAPLLLAGGALALARHQRRERLAAGAGAPA